MSAALTAAPISGSIETSTSWVIAFTAVTILSITYGSPLVVVVAMKAISADLGAPREVPALAAAMSWFGAGLGAIFMGWVADRIGVRWTVMTGAVMICVGMAVSAMGTSWSLYLGQGLFVGLLGNAGLFAPLLIYVSRWFDRRRGTALALISSGQYIAGMIWPTLFEMGNARFGWQTTSVAYGVLVAVLVVPVALIMLRAPPAAETAAALAAGPQRGAQVLGMHPNITMGLLGAAAFLCCVPMALPQGHLVAFCSDLGLTRGASMLSVMLAAAFIARQFWGYLSDEIGGLYTVLLGSACQALAMVAFMSTQDEIGLFAVTAAYGFGFSGIIPAYVLAIRQLFPASEAGWRVPVVLFFGMGGMAFGGWFAGMLYDRFGSYGSAFAAGLAFNLVNLLVVGFLLLRGRGRRASPGSSPGPSPGLVPLTAT